MRSKWYQILTDVYPQCRDLGVQWKASASSYCYIFSNRNTVRKKWIVFYWKESRTPNWDMNICWIHWLCISWLTWQVKIVWINLILVGLSFNRYFLDKYLLYKHLEAWILSKKLSFFRMLWSDLFSFIHLKFFIVVAKLQVYSVVIFKF